MGHIGELLLLLPLLARRQEAHAAAPRYDEYPPRSLEPTSGELHLLSFFSSCEDPHNLCTPVRRSTIVEGGRCAGLGGEHRVL